MSDDKGRKVPGSKADNGKAKRLEAALRANLKRRKTQARVQSTPATPAAPAVEQPEIPHKSGEK
ncbi:MAG: hypothetical protein K8S25_07855 [Alphaproteobacteria bacterium]|nr:hypothetical protein [Alphaproteobacteria bacterium]